MSYDNWKLDTPDNHLKPCKTCEHCPEPIYEGEEYLLLNDGLTVHMECFSEFALDYLVVGGFIAGEDE